MTQASIQLPVTGTVSGLQNNQDANSAFQSLATDNSGNTAPTTGSTGLSALSGVAWHDTSANLDKLRDQADTAWMTRGAYDETNKLFMPYMNNLPIGTALNGGFVNLFRNAPLDIWQRGTSGSVTAGSPSYTADGWIIGCTGANVAWAQATGRALSLNSLQITGASSVTDALIKQRIESFLSGRCASQQVTFQAYVFNNTGSSITPTLTVKHATAADNWASTATDVNAVSLQACPNGQWTQIFYTFTASSSSGNGLEITVDFGNNFSTNGKSVKFCEADLRVTPGALGSNTSGTPVFAPPTPEMRFVQQELALCQRYLPAWNSSGTTSSIGSAFVNQANIFFAPIALPVPARVTPSGVSISNAAHFSANIANSVYVASGITLNSASPNAINLSFTTTGGTAGQGGILYFNNAGGQLLATGCEL